MIFSDIIIVDAEGMKKFVNDKYHYKTFFIPYGANLIDEAPWDEDKLETLNIYNKLKQYITMNRYWLVVSRLEPGNNIEVIIKAFLEAKTKFPLIIVGNFANNKFRKEIENLVAMSKDRIFLTGGIYESEVLEILRQNCFAYIHGHSTGGTNPSLLEIMISKTIIIAHDNMFNKEVCQDTALYFNSVNDLKNKLGMLESNPSPYVDLKEKAYNRVRENYNWDKIINEYENVFLNALNP